MIPPYGNKAQSTLHSAGCDMLLPHTCRCRDLRIHRRKDHRRTRRGLGQDPGVPRGIGLGKAGRQARSSFRRQPGDVELRRRLRSPDVGGSSVAGISGVRSGRSRRGFARIFAVRRRSTGVAKVRPGDWTGGRRAGRLACVLIHVVSLVVRKTITPHGSEGFFFGQTQLTSCAHEVRVVWDSTRAGVGFGVHPPRQSVCAWQHVVFKCISSLCSLLRQGREVRDVWFTRRQPFRARGASCLPLRHERYHER